MASCASLTTVAFVALPVVVGSLAAGAGSGYRSNALFDQAQVCSATMFGGLGVLMAWLTLLVCGRWHAERSWVDRLGRAMGLYWIVAAFALWAAFFYIDTFGGQGFKINVNTQTIASSAARNTLRVTTALMPLVAVISLALIPIRLFRKRPRSPRPLSAPGLIAPCVRVRRSRWLGSRSS